MSDKSNSFTVNWDIQDFSLLPTRNNREMLSPPWYVTTTNGGYVELRLGVCSSDTKIIIQVHTIRFAHFFSIAWGYEVYLTSSSKKFQLKKESNTQPKISFSIEKSAIFGDSNDVTLLKNDTLKIYCKIWGEQIIAAGEYYLYTKFQRVNFEWNIQYFNYDTTYNWTFKEENNLFKVRIYPSEGYKRYNVYVEGKEDLPGLFNEVFTIIDFKLSSEPKSNFMTDSTHICIVPYSQYWLGFFTFNNERTNFNNESSQFCLQLRIKCLIAIKELGCRPISSVESIKTTVPSKPNRDSSGTLKSDLLQLYKEKNFSDATLKTEGKSFSAHKNILSARSSVFKAMFEKQETTEGRSGVVNIEDIDSDTVQRLLVFLYSESLDEMQWEAASKLYYAADKYAVQLLKQKCAGFLKAGLTVSNVCDAAVLADRHSDEDLMKCAVDYIRDHQEVISSSDWESLEKCEPGLAAKILRQVFVEKRKM